MVIQQTVLLDLSRFKLANFDLKPLKFLLKCMQDNYPDSVALVIIHDAPFGAKCKPNFSNRSRENEYTVQKHEKMEGKKKP